MTYFITLWLSKVIYYTLAKLIMKGVFQSLFLILVFFFSDSKSQGFKKLYINESANGKPLTELLDSLEVQHNVSFVYNDVVLEGLTVFGVGKDYKVEDFLNVFLPTHKAIKLSNSEMIIVDEILWEKYGNISSNYLILKRSNETLQNLTGDVMDANTLEPIVGAEVYIPYLKSGTVTNTDGKYSIKVEKRIYEIEIRYTGYDSETFLVGFGSLGENKLETYLYESSTQLENITIHAENQDRNVSSIVTGVEKMDIEAIKTLPTFMGEVDPIRSLATLPGVSTAGELSSGFHVRGGENGQNLILQENGIIFNPTHLFGFFSAFNPDMVQEVELHKGGGSAKYGGRVSSVLDLSLRNGDMINHKVTGGVGLVSSRLSIEGPLKKNRTSYLIGGRISYPNWLLHSINNIELNNSYSNFYDVTGKVFHIINSNNFLEFTGYYSFDNFNFGNDSTYSWATKNFSIAWDHTFNENITSTLSVASSNYQSELLNSEEFNGFNYRNSINNVKIKYDLNHSKGEHELIYGIEGNGSIMEPGKLRKNASDGNVLDKDINDQRALELAVYGQGNIKFSPKLALSAGVRASLFFRLGKDDIYTFDYNNLNGRYPTITDTTMYSKGDIISTYSGIEPRISIRYMLDDHTSFKASYYRTMQYLHLISYTTAPTPQDYWMASGPYIKPEIGNQFTLGYFKNSSNGKFEYSIEGYYKPMKNTIDYIEGADILLNESLEAALAQGDGLSYGLEVQLKKISGKIYGWISYTYSRSLRRFNKTKGALDQINNGEYYPTIHDQPNNISLVANCKTGKRSTLSVNFTYSTGRPITIPDSKFTYGPFLSVLNYSERNEYRIPDFHRLDLSWNIKDRR
jgi:hypothetical protein